MSRRRCSPKQIAEATDKTHGSVKVPLGEMVKAGQVANPSYGKYTLPSDNAYPPYPANSEGEEEGEGKEGKRSKGKDEGADEPPEPGTVISLRKAPNARNHSGGALEELAAFLEDPPGWYVSQAEECKRQGAPERLLRPLATAVAHEFFGDTHRWSEVLPRVEASPNEGGSG